MSTAQVADVIIVGTGLAGLAAAAELADAGRRVLFVEQENAENVGGQAYWSFGGLFFVDSPEQRRAGIRDSHELAWRDWQATAGFDRDRDDHWPRQWAEAYVDFAAGEKRAWLGRMGLKVFPAVGWAERGGAGADAPGNSVPRFHITWGTGPALVELFTRRLAPAVAAGRVRFAHRHRVDELIVEAGAVAGVRGSVLEPSDAARGVASSRTTVGDFEFRAQAVVVASGGIGGDPALVRRFWPARLGTPPRHMLTGVPAHVDGRMLAVSETAGANLVNRDRMWHYTEGITNYDPIWPNHGIRILPGPSSLWLDATGTRLPAPLFPGYDTLATTEHILSTGHDHTWFIATQKIIEKEFGLSGQEQNPDLTGRDLRKLLQRAKGGAPGPVDAFTRRGVDFIVRDTLPELVAAMNALTGENLLDYERVHAQVAARDAQLANPYGKDPQLAAITVARKYLPDRIIRVAAPHRLLDPAAGPLIAVRLHLLTRKTLGGIETDLGARVIAPDGGVLPGLYAVGEVAGFGGGGMHGYRALEGSFLGGCLFSGRTAGRALHATL
ncbi:FAD-binding dehydrogenase [Nocardia stercoris]|uniref:FAD-binding dehydrogenase n=1 Tax=Nocardia stercoris TaxID=2483361 RepID=A0A3M2KSW9_9NOCA|nr:FAD-binding dehydrogenase [Nocardia stercoris]RMI28181.1 FAD-binding dehydrogenase [Nocardia stercoris]